MIVISVTKKQYVLNILRISLSLGRRQTHLSEVNPMGSMLDYSVLLVPTSNVQEILFQRESIRVENYHCC